VNEINSKGTGFEIRGNHHKSDDSSPKQGMTFQQNSKYTMNRLKYVEGHG